MSALAPGVRILATFAPQRLRDADAVAAACTNALDIRYTPGEGAPDEARLLCAAVEPKRVAPGETMTVRACWQALAPMNLDYTAFFHLLGPDNQRVAERHTYPGLGRFPTSHWPIGGAFCETYRMQVAPWADAPLRYRLAVGLFDAESGTRMAASDGAGRPVEPPLVGGVTVIRARPPLGDYKPIDAHLGFEDITADIELLGFNVPEAAAPGETIKVTFYWQALTPPQEDYVAFVHLRRPEDSEPLAQHDSMPRQGWYPTSLWAGGDRVPDAHPLAIPAELPAGSYPLWAGLYRADGARLPAYGTEGRYQHDLIPLGEIEIR
jgi:hypothetical protein